MFITVTCILSTEWTKFPNTQSSHLWRAWYPYRLDRGEGHGSLSDWSC